MKKIETLTADIEAKKKKEPELGCRAENGDGRCHQARTSLAAAKDAVDRAAKAIPTQQAVVETAKGVLANLQTAATALAEKAKLFREELPVAFGFDATVTICC